MKKIDVNAKANQLIGNIPDEILGLLNFHETAEVILTKERLEKNKRKHKELDLDYYHFLFDLIENPTFVCTNKTDKQTTIIYYGPVNTGEEGIHFLRVAVLLKSPKEPPEYKNSIQSFRICREKELLRDIKRERLIWKKEEIKS